MQCVLESGTVVCDDVAEADADLRRAARVGRRAGPCRTGCAWARPATHPFSLYENQKITARDRYRQLVEMLQYVARRELVFGMHVHVAVPTPEACLAVMEGVLIELPVLLALSANSPFWRGEPRRPRTRPARWCSPRSRAAACRPASTSYQDYAEAVGFMEATGAIGDYTHLWWDVRPHPRFGTLEMRVMDVPDAGGGRDRARRLRPVPGEAPGRPVRGRRAGAGRSTACCCPRTSGSPLRYGLDAPLMDLAAGKRVEDAGADARQAPDARAASRSPASSAAPRSSPGSSGSSRTATAPTVSAGLEREPRPGRGGRGDRDRQRKRVTGGGSRDDRLDSRLHPPAPEEPDG